MSANDIASYAARSQAAPVPPNIGGKGASPCRRLNANTRCSINEGPTSSPPAIAGGKRGSGSQPGPSPDSPQTSQQPFGDRGRVGGGREKYGGLLATGDAERRRAGEPEALVRTWLIVCTEFSTDFKRSNKTVPWALLSCSCSARTSSCQAARSLAVGLGKSSGESPPRPRRRSLAGLPTREPAQPCRRHGQRGDLGDDGLPKLAVAVS
mmetsp:Transcript_139481/g.446241  ORF Transcript_139481/g.446241 Transcript_139481/m.446241 type:complete len:209 (+) Transcript_139481:383-1009(+)